MIVLTVECSSAEKDGVSADLYDSGTIGIVEEETSSGRVRLKAYFEANPQLPSGLVDYQPAVEPADTTDWVALSQSQWEPLRVGERFYLVPAWLDEPAPEGRLRLVMPAGSASGTGLHPATQLAIEALERTVCAGNCVLDLGTGSGILSAVAILLGAQRVIACDIDEDAVRSARDYLADRRALLYTGSTRSLPDESVGLVVANLSRQVLSAAASEIARVLTPDGRAVLSGFSSDRPPRVGHALKIQETLTRAGWGVWIARKAAGDG